MQPFKKEGINTNMFAYSKKRGGMGGQRKDKPKTFQWLPVYGWGQE